MACLALRLGTLALLLAALARPVQAQDPAGAETAAQTYADATAARDWEAMAQITDPEDLTRFADFLGVFAQLVAEEIDDPTALIEAETPEDAFVAFMDIVMGAAPMMDDMMASVEAQILGSVPEGDSLVHVVSRSSFSMMGEDVSSVEVITARWDGSRWVVRLGEEIEDMIAGFEAMAGDPEFLNSMGIAQPSGHDPKKQ